MTGNGFSNKELTEMIMEEKVERQKLAQEMKATREAIKKYNNLVGKINSLERWRQQVCGSQTTWDAIRQWSGWIVAVGTLTYYLWG